MSDSFIAGAIAGFGIAIPVGPVAVLIIELGVRRGLHTAVAAALGTATADVLYATLAVVAGAGIAAHLHQHVVPRWGGDTNFMPVVGHTKVLPQLLRDTRRMLADAWLIEHPSVS